MAQAAASRPKLLSAMIDGFRQADVRQKLLFTFGLLVVFRFVAHVPVPGVDRDVLASVFESNAVLGFLNLFSGGALENLSVAALGVYPYITASIIMQILTPIVPSLQALSKEGEQGRQRIQLYTHWLTVPLAMAQGYGQLIIIQQAGGISGIGLSGSSLLPTFSMVISMAAGTMFLVWLGELITERGIGNGVSIIIFGGIVAGLPRLFGQIFQNPAGTAFGGMVLVLMVGLILVYSIVVFQEATRKVPVPWRPHVPAVELDAYTAESEQCGYDPADLRVHDHHFPGHRRPAVRNVRQRIHLCDSGVRDQHLHAAQPCLLARDVLLGAGLHVLLHGGGLPATEPGGEPAEAGWVRAGHSPRTADPGVHHTGADAHHLGRRNLPRRCGGRAIRGDTVLQ